MKRRDFFNTTGVALVKIPLVTAGHGGGDTRLQDRIFRNPDDPDPYRHGAGSPRWRHVESVGNCCAEIDSRKPDREDR